MRKLTILLTALLVVAALPLLAQSNYHYNENMNCSDCHSMHASAHNNLTDGTAITTPNGASSPNRAINPYYPAPNPGPGREALLKNDDVCSSCHKDQSFAPDVFGDNLNGSTVRPPGYDGAGVGNYFAAGSELECVSCTRRTAARTSATSSRTRCAERSAARMRPRSEARAGRGLAGDRDEQRLRSDPRRESRRRRASAARSGREPHRRRALSTRLEERRKEFLEELWQKYPFLYSPVARTTADPEAVVEPLLVLEAAAPHMDESPAIVEEVTKYREYLMEGMLFRDHIFKGLAATDDESRKYHDEHKTEFVAPEQRRVAQILSNNEKDAAAARQALAAGTAFAAAVKKYSRDPISAMQEGDLGWITPDRVPAASNRC